MKEDSGLLSIDFIVGFTIFMIAFIIVITMISGYFVGLESQTVDHDAIAYRTGVILVEDPGYTENRLTSWELNDIDHTSNILRFGLAYSDDPLGASRNYPNILSSPKIEKFFCSTYFPLASDYENRLMFGDRPYWYNISLRSVGNDKYVYHTTNAFSDPQDYGYIRRVVKIREPGAVNIDAQLHNSTIQGGTYSIKMDFSALYSYNAPYLVDPLQDKVVINIYNAGLNSTLSGLPQTKLNKVEIFEEGATNPIQSLDDYITIDGDPSAHPPHSVSNTINMTLEPGFFSTYAGKSSKLLITYTFDPAGGYGMAGTDTNNFTVDTHNGAIYWPWPRLTPAILEVKIW